MYKKNEGQVMTPGKVTEIILDAVGYHGREVLNKKIMEPSFGEGVFIIEIIKRIIHEGKVSGIPAGGISQIIKNNVFGIEKDPVLYNKALENISTLILSSGIPETDLSGTLLNEDTLRLYKDFSGTMDFVAGNPPYVDPEHMDKDVLSYIKENFISCSGKTDLSIAFYEMGLRMLRSTGKLGFISPNSFMKNASQAGFRDLLVREKYISGIFDFRTSKIFPGTGTYTCICILDKDNDRPCHDITYREYDMYETVEESVLPFDYFSTLKGRPWNLASGAGLKFLDGNNKRPVKVKDIATVQNGIATNRDKVYIHKVYLSNGSPYSGKHTDKNMTVYLDAWKENGGIPVESAILHRCVKASKFSGEMSNLYILFPYEAAKEPDVTGELSGKAIETGYTVIPEDKMKSEYKLAYSYLLSHYDELQSRDMEGPGVQYRFGRSQGLLNSGLKKIVFKHIIERKSPAVTPYILDWDVIVYSGIFTTIDITKLITKEGSGYLFNESIYDTMITELADVFREKDFPKYLSIVGKDMQGGYIAFSAKQVSWYGTGFAAISGEENGSTKDSE